MTNTVRQWVSAAGTVAPPGYSRWLVPPAALALHLAIGQIYAFSMLSGPLQGHFQASHTAIGWIFSLAIAVLGLTAAFGGGWVSRIGPRQAMLYAGLFWVSGYLVAAAGIAANQLWLVYVGYGLIGGIGLGIGYVAPVATLMAWFPDKPGLAGGMAIMGFGGGAMLASPLISALLARWEDKVAVPLIPTLLVLAGLNAVLMFWAAAVIRTPPTPAAAGTAAVPSLPAQKVLRTPAFWLLWLAFFANIAAGIGIIEQAAPMITGFFPALSVGAAAGFVGLLSLANMAGRFGWSTLSDRLGRPIIMSLFAVAGVVVFLVLAQWGSTSITLFVVLAVAQVSFYGGGFSTVPAYLKDLFGGANLSVILGLILTAWSAAGIVGPLLFNSMVDAQEAAGVTGAAKYQDALYYTAGLLAVAVAANLVLWSLHRRHRER